MDSPTTDIDVSPINIITVIQQRRMELLTSGVELDKLNLALMRDMSVTAMAESRLANDASLVENTAELAAMLAQVVTDGGANLLKSSGGTIIGKSVELKALPAIIAVEGELSNKPSDLQYSDLCE